MGMHTETRRSLLIHIRIVTDTDISTYTNTCPKLHRIPTKQLMFGDIEMLKDDMIRLFHDSAVNISSP